MLKLCTNYLSDLQKLAVFVFSAESINHILFQASFFNTVWYAPHRRGH